MDCFKFKGVISESDGICLGDIEMSPGRISCLVGVYISRERKIFCKPFREIIIEIIMEKKDISQGY